MAKIITWIFVLCLVLFGSNLSGQAVLESYPSYPKTLDLRKKLVQIELSQVGVREKTGNNDGPEVEMYLRYVGLKKGNPYCAAGQAWSHGKADIPNPESGYSPDWFRANVVYVKGKYRATPFRARIGQVVGFWVDYKKRIGHVGMIVAVFADHYKTVEFNTNGFGSDEGQGVHILLRRKESVYAVSDFVGWKEYLDGVKQLKKK